ncbi:prolipoprotein diacylglyceryl transferase [Mariniblastus fucicola]|uniref:Phosphatidylglycerol--prolipoprotein diacylglyceryl transferase n=1 Tax=Mariniblastus fucicola TaxID=980251 RepID=A0A5B9PD01_9BACT|nr:prolipoprotein diacylglyceryl transferase [Mariniblastus fucicola]QEG24637.1 Prolipoprotein diacylglyceryl transferase [Mariniblastus fucicola]
MLQTLFYIPPSWFGVPGAIGWVLLCGLWLGIVAIRDRANLKAEFTATLPIIVVGCIAMMFLLPKLAKDGIDPADPLGDPINRGLAIRGYGMMLMLAVLSGMSIVFYRCRKIGYPTEHIFRLAVAMILCGMLGARLFFVIQNHDHFFKPEASLIETVSGIFDMVGGGLVVYGSMIGALLASALVVWKWKLPVWMTADLIAPGMALGLAIGRIGCLLNGCCWGGVCDVQLPAIEFPAGSPAYMQQLYSGELLGIETEAIANEPGFFRVTDPGNGVGKEIGLTEGETISVYTGLDADRVRYLIGTPKAGFATMEVVGDRIGRSKVPMTKLRQRSNGVHPTQIYSSVNAFVLCLFLWFYWHVRRNDGEVMGLMLILYPISRFVLELIRNDESGQFGTELTISQWVSLLTIACGVGLFAYARMFGSRAEVPKLVTQQDA